MISALVLSKNEEKNITKCLQALSWCDELIVIDDFSTDRTIEKTKSLKVKIYQRNLDKNFAAQRNFGLSKAKGGWVLFIDGDEEISAELSSEIKFKIKTFVPSIRPELMPRGSGRGNEKFKIYNGFYLRRKDKFLGKWLRFGETNSVRLLRLAKKGVGKWQGAIHETWQVKGKTGVLKNPILHDRRMSVSDFLERINHYSEIRSKQLFDQQKKTNPFLIVIFPTAKFVQNYFLRMGFLDGFPGLAMAFFMSLHSLLTRCKLYLLWQKND